MKKTLIIVTLATMVSFANTRSFEDFYEYKVDNKVENNEIEEIIYKGNSYFTSLSLMSNLKSLQIGSNMTDNNVLNNQELFFIKKNPAKQIKIDFEKTDNNKVRVFVHSLSNFRREYNINMGAEIDTFNEFIPTFEINYKNWNLSGANRTLYTGAKINPFLPLQYFNFYFVTDFNYRKNEKLKYYASFIYSQNYRAAYTKHKTNFVFFRKWEKFFYINRLNSVSFNADVNYFFEYNKDKYTSNFKHYISVPLYFKQNYISDNLTFEFKEQVNLGLYFHPIIFPTISTNFDFYINYDIGNWSFSTDNRFFYSVFKIKDINFEDLQKRYQIRSDKRYDIGQLVFISKNTIYYNTSSVSPYLFTDIKVVDRDLNALTTGIGLDYKLSEKVSLDTNLGFNFREKYYNTMKLDLSLNIKLR